VNVELRRALPLLVLFVVGLAAGIWVFIAPWVIGYPTDHGWSSSIWTSVLMGGVLSVFSAACLVATLASTVHAVRRVPEPGGE
jgi:hypothetical protein